MSSPAVEGTGYVLDPEIADEIQDYMMQMVFFESELKRIGEVASEAREN